ncbi:hypothetical protein [Actinocorallia aurantiaca]|uniref:Tle cognate immunity protein 4 C-terminal domain-containing protein n=1 Tax=Actinocorallia aurantiaca TaxID=46204 RepID=A0ABN3UBX3_9ACTN
MRAKRVASMAGVLLMVLGLIGAVSPARKPSAPIREAAVPARKPFGPAGEPRIPALDYQASGCPAEPYEGAGVHGWPDPDRTAPAYSRSLAPRGADHALLCQAFDPEKSSWFERLRIVRGVEELQQIMDALPLTEPGGVSTMVGFPELNLVLHYPDGRRVVASFEFNRGEVSSYRAVRRGATRLTREFARLWRAEHTSLDPSEVEPAACLSTQIDLREDTFRHPAPPIVRGFDAWSVSDEPKLPSPLSVVRACRYTADKNGQLTLRTQKAVRTGLEPVRTAVNTRKKPKRIRCGEYGRPPLTALDTLHLTDVTGRTEHVYVAREPCETEKTVGYAGGMPVAPEISAMLARLLD